MPRAVVVSAGALVTVMVWVICRAGVTCRSRARVERFFHSCEEASLFGVAGDLHALELTAEPDIDVQVTSILMEVKERPVCPREVAAPALLQLRELA